MGNNHDFSSVMPHYLVVSIINPRLKPYFTNHLSNKLRCEANDGIKMIIDLKLGRSIFLCSEENILSQVIDPINHVTGS